MKRKLIYLIVLLVTLFPLISVHAEKYDNYNPNNVVSCGQKLLTDIPVALTKTVRYGYVIIQVAVPVLLVVMGLLDLLKAIYASKEDEIKKGQSIFIKRLIAAAIVFFVFAIVKIVISFTADSTSSRIIKCAECFLENNCNT